MTINKRALKEFATKRELDDYYWLKELSIKEVKAALNDVYPENLLHERETLYHHQYCCELIQLALPGFLFYLDMGLGKTQLMLSKSQYERDISNAKSLILCPRNTALYNLCDELDQYSDLEYCSIIGTEEEKLYRLFESDVSASVITYPGLTALCTHRVYDKKKGKNVTVVDKQFIERLRKLFDVFHFDEVHNLKNHQTLIFRICRQLTKGNLVYGYTGTPTSRNPEDFWSEFYLVDRGETLGDTLGLFREAFLESRDHFFKGKEYYLGRKDKRDIFYRTLRHRSIIYFENECFDMPRDNRIVKVTENSEASFRSHYNAVIETIKQSKSNKVDPSLFIKLREITAGFLRVGKNDVVELISLKDNPKINLLLDVLEGLEKKVVIFYEFTYNAINIEKALKTQGYNDFVVVSYKNTKQHKELITRFKEDSNCKKLVISSGYGGESLNLQVSNMVVFFESPVSPIVRKQAEKRIRPRLHTHVTFVDLILKDSIDERILELLSQGENLYDMLKGKNINLPEL